MSAKFSPGPWRIEARVDDEMQSEYMAVTCDADYEVASLQDSDNPHPNARLIAAAPEMYELLKRLGFGGFEMANTRAGYDARALLARIDGDGE